MRVSVILLCLITVFSLLACTDDFESGESEIQVSTDGVDFTEGNNKAVVSPDGTEYAFVGFEGNVWCFGEYKFIGGVTGEKEAFVHLDTTIKTGMYSVDNGQDVLVRYFPDNEFAAIYVKSDLLKTEVALENCIRFEFIRGLLYNNNAPISGKGITECERFLAEIKSGPTAEKAGLYDLVKQPDGMLKNCYVYGHVCGVLQDDLNLVIPLEITSFDDKAYSVKIDDTEYALSQEWLDKLEENS